MGAASYPISSVNPVPIYPGGKQAPVTLYNQDITHTVYVSDVPSGLSGFPLGAGDTITWDGDKALYAWVDAGVTVTLIVLDNGGSITSARAIADQIIEAGLASDIAAAITASPLAGNIGGAVPQATDISGAIEGSTLPTNTADAVAAAGVPIIDNPVTAYNTLGSGATIYLDTSRYQSVHLAITPVEDSSWSVYLASVDGNTSGAQVLDTRAVLVTGESISEAKIYVTVPAVGKYLRITTGRSTGTGSIAINTLCSYRPADRFRYLHMRGSSWTGVGLAQDGFARYSPGTIAASGNARGFIPCKAGRATVNYICNTGAGTTGYLYVMDDASNVLISATALPAATTALMGSFDIILPSRPVSLYWVAGTGGITNPNVSITFDSNN